MQNRAWRWGMGWLALVLVGAMPAGAQPEEERPAPEAERRDLRAALERREQALAEAGRRLREMEAQLREQRMRRPPEPAGPVVRLFPLTPALQGVGEALEPLGKLPETRFLVLPEQVAVWGPPAAVEAVTRILTALDPTLQPRSLTLTVRVYVAAEALPPQLNVLREDPLLPQVQKRTGYKNVSLLAGVDLPGIEGESFQLENEMGVKGDWGELHGVLRLTAMPQLLDHQQVQMKTSVQVEWMVGTGNLRRLHYYEGLLRTAAGQAVLVVSDDPISRSALVLALAPFVGE